MTENTITVFDFTTKSNLSNWYVVLDGVMGGLSQGNFNINTKGNAVFSGVVSLENNGGFSSIRYGIGHTNIAEKTMFSIRLKGDGKTYKFRIKENAADNHTFMTTFETSGDWETIEIPLSSLYPSFRGRKLDIGNFAANYFEELGFLIANRTKEVFQLELDYMELK